MTDNQHPATARPQLPRHVTIREVGLRDGIQSLGAFVDTTHKIELINALSASGVMRIEATSFVNPSVIPQMADASTVMAAIDRWPGVKYEALVPNVRGAQDALAAGVDALVLVLTASEAFNQRNVRMSVAQSLGQFGEITKSGRQASVSSIGVVGTAFGCPYEGDISTQVVFDLIEHYVTHLGMDEVILADTTGMANPLQVQRIVQSVLDRWGDHVTLGLHFHNTRGMGLANVLAALHSGATQFDASIGGIGGCPFAPQAAGNICTEDAVHMLHELGVETGIDLDRLIGVARRARDILNQELPGQVMKAGPRWQLVKT